MVSRPYLDPYVAQSADAADAFYKVMAGQMGKLQFIGLDGQMVTVEPLQSGGIVYTPPKAMSTSTGGVATKPTNPIDTGEGYAPGYELVDAPSLVLPDLINIWSDPLVRETFDNIVADYGGAYGYMNLPPAAGDSQMITASYHESYTDNWNSPTTSSWSYYTRDTTASLKGLESAGATTMTGVASYYRLDQWGDDYSSNWQKTTGTNTLTVAETPITFGYAAPWGSGDLYSSVLHTATFTNASTTSSGHNPTTGSEPVTNTEWSVTFSQLGGDPSDFATMAGNAMGMLTNEYPTQSGTMGSLANLFVPPDPYGYCIA